MGKCGDGPNFATLVIRANHYPWPRFLLAPSMDAPPCGRRPGFRARAALLAAQVAASSSHRASHCTPVHLSAHELLTRTIRPCIGANNAAARVYANAAVSKRRRLYIIRPRGHADDGFVVAQVAADDERVNSVGPAKYPSIIGNHHRALGCAASPAAVVPSPDSATGGGNNERRRRVLSRGMPG